MFKGVSMLRAEERKAAAATAAPSAQASAMAEYLKRYTADGDAAGGTDPKKKKKKSKKDPKPAAGGGAIKIIDHDEERAVQGVTRKLAHMDDGPEEQEEDDDDDSRPVIANEAEAKFLIKQSRKSEKFYQAGRDGSGWVNVGGDDGGGRSGQRRHDSPNASPPQRSARHDSPDASPPRRGARHDSPDASPPRLGARHDSPDASPPRRGARHDSPDASPPRRGARHDSPDASPPRRTAGHESPDASPPRRHARHDSPDASPPRRRARHDSPDPSPPRRPPSRSPGGPNRPGGAPRMGDGTATGLVSAQQLQEETARMKAEAVARRAAATGRGAETVYRDKATGKIVSKEEFQASRAPPGKKARQQEEDPAAQHLEWRGGLAQRKQAEAVAARLAEEARKPFARYEDDRDRDAMLRARVHFGDPMAGKTRQPTEAEPDALTARYDAQRLEQSGFIIPQGVPSHSWMKRGVPPPANRYNIRPGRHWDGVDRSNGFEREMFKHMATVRHREQEAREWAMSDM